ncbi:hypothetical protein, partial [Nocardioides sp.]|uniref:hypothetical protein n=1 Tax=Nocardioides sp. TaxID=35761 RepID=UPI00286E992A
GYGLASDRAVSGDWDGNGTDEVGVYRPAEGTFYQRRPDGTSATVLLGDVDDLPVSGDWDGNGVTDLGVFDQATATFTLRLVDANAHVWTSQLPLGVAGDLPVAGDWDGDAITDLGVWAPGTATFTQGRAVFPMTSAPADAVATRMAVTTVQFGLPRR